MSEEAKPLKDCIVVVDDSKPNRDIMTQNLRKFDFDVEFFENGKKAWDYIKETSKPLVAVFSDLMMPELNGIDLLKNVRKHERYSKLPFVLVTTMVAKDYILEAKNLGVNGYLVKPINSDQFQSKLKEIFPGRKAKSSI